MGERLDVNYVLVTGGLGYIGSHVVFSLVKAGFHPIVVDSLIGAGEDRIKKIRKVAGQDVIVRVGDVRDKGFLDAIFTRFHVMGVIHLAGLKSVSDSFEVPIDYYSANLHGVICLIDAMQRAGVFRLIFSSSATVYSPSNRCPLDENACVGQQVNPYGRTKRFAEAFLEDVSASDSRWRVCALRYFNPIGADSSGDLPEEPLGKPANIMPNILNAALGITPYLSIHGDDYDTRDGTGARDYIHVSDLSDGHVVAFEYLDCREGFSVFNLGTGQSHTVLELVAAFESATGLSVPVKLNPRRPGDLPIVYADVDSARRELNFKTKRGLNEMCRDSLAAAIKRRNEKR